MSNQKNNHDNTCPSTSCNQAFLINMNSKMNAWCISKSISSGTRFPKFIFVLVW